MAQEQVMGMDDLVGEILRRLPPDEPACLFRASLVSRDWRRLLTDPDGLRRYREFHRAPPLVAFLRNTHSVDDPVPRFVPTAAASPLAPPAFACEHWLALDCRHGRVLVHTLNPTGLVVWNPVTGYQERLPDEPPLLYNHFAGAVLCAADGCAHRECREGPVRVVFVGTFAEEGEEVFTWASAYSSETGAWATLATVEPGQVMDSPDVMGPSLLAGGALYFTLDLHDRRTILEYDLAENALSVVSPPPLVGSGRDLFLVTAEDGGLGIAIAQGYYLHLWSRRAAADGVLGWVRDRVIDLMDMIPLAIGDPTTKLHVVGFAEGADIIFISAADGVSTLELKSAKVTKVSETSSFNTIFPCVTFYTLGMEAVPAGMEAVPAGEELGDGALGIGAVPADEEPGAGPLEIEAIPGGEESGAGASGIGAASTGQERGAGSSGA